jgi:hypothetical protein
LPQDSGGGGGAASGPPNVLFDNPSNPAGVTNATYLMAGLAEPFTPSKSGVIQITISGQMQVTGVTVNAGLCKIAYGTGAAPNNGDAATGTVIGTATRMGNTVANLITPFSITVTKSGLALATPIWIDLQQRADAGTTMLLYSLNVNVVEL